MFTLDDSEKWATTADVICLAELALRWPYQAILKITYELYFIDREILKLYERRDEALTADGQKFHLLREAQYSDDIGVLIQKIPQMLFLREAVEHVERERPEYKATKSLKDEDNSLCLATKDNLHKILPHILWVWHKNYSTNDDYRSILINIQKENSNTSISDLLKCPSELLEKMPEHLFPDFISDFNSRKSITLVDLAKEFLTLCNIKKDSDKLLALIEIDKRFPGLSNKEIGQIFPPPSGTEDPDSIEKSGYRLRSEAGKYKKIPFDKPVH